jgi:prophage regulatory protein
MSEPNAFPAPERRILRCPEVLARVGFKRAYLYAQIKAGKFPKPIPLGIRAVGWDSAEIEQWILGRIRERA